MSIEVTIPKDIMEYKPKSWWGFTARQLGALAAAVACSILFWFVCCYLLEMPFDVLTYPIMIVGLPALWLGWAHPKGHNPERYLMLLMRHKFAKKKLPYVSKIELPSEVEKKEQTNALTKAERKQLKKEAAQNRKIRRREHECNAG